MHEAAASPLRKQSIQNEALSLSQAVATDADSDKNTFEHLDKCILAIWTNTCFAIWTNIFELFGQMHLSITQCGQMYLSIFGQIHSRNCDNYVSIQDEALSGSLDK